MFTDAQDVKTRFEALGYITPDSAATAVFIADRLEKPLLVEGPVGAGKTELAKTWAAAGRMEFIRLQCYEGLDEAKALYEWEYAKQLLYTQILKDKLAQTLGDASTLREAAARLAAEEDLFFSMDFIAPRPVLRALMSENPTLLLVDEVDRADAEFEAFLLEVLSDSTISIPEIGTVKAARIPRVVLTSNASREISDALRRRCLHLDLAMPSREDEVRILEARVPGIGAALGAKVAAFAEGVRRMNVARPPSVSETIDWARALVVLAAADLDRETVRRTLGLLVKNADDAARVLAQLDKPSGKPVS
jgi:MoxR-like ATPase